MPDYPTAQIGSHHQSQIAMHARSRAALHVSGLPEAQSSIADRERRERLGLSGEFVIATKIGQIMEFVNFDGDSGDGGVDLWNDNVSIDVKTEGPRRSGSPVRAYPAGYRAKVITFVRQSTADRFGEFEILGWLFAHELQRMASGNEHVDVCLCHLRPIDSLPPHGHYDVPDPDLEEHCPECGRLI